MKIPKVTFKFNVEKDLHNIWDTCNSKSTYGYDFSNQMSPNIIKICKGKKFDKCKVELNKTMSEVHNSTLINDISKTAQKSWNQINDEYFRRLKKIMKKPICSEKFTGYLTISGRCPYNPEKDYFMFGMFRGIPSILHTAGHEIMHIQFHKTYWEKVEKELGYNKTHDLKEALTILLNLEFKDLWFSEDYGYPNHKKLRAFIEKEWEKKKDFGVLLDKCIRYMKK